MLRVYSKPVADLEVGERGCLVPLKGAKASLRVPFDAVSWVSDDWYDKDTLRPKVGAA